MNDQVTFFFISAFLSSSLPFVQRLNKHSCIGRSLELNVLFMCANEHIRVCRCACVRICSRDCFSVVNMTSIFPQQCALRFRGLIASITKPTWGSRPVYKGTIFISGSQRRACWDTYILQKEPVRNRLTMQYMFCIYRTLYTNSVHEDAVALVPLH